MSMLPLIVMLFFAKLRGEHSPSPFFHAETGEFRVVPQMLSEAQLRQVRSGVESTPVESEMGAPSSGRLRLAWRSGSLGPFSRSRWPTHIPTAATRTKEAATHERAARLQYAGDRGVSGERWEGRPVREPADGDPAHDLRSVGRGAGDPVGSRSRRRRAADLRQRRRRPSTSLLVLQSEGSCPNRGRAGNGALPGGCRRASRSPAKARSRSANRAAVRGIRGSGGTAGHSGILDRPDRLRHGTRRPAQRSQNAGEPGDAGAGAAIIGTSPSVVAARSAARHLYFGSTKERRFDNCGQTSFVISSIERRERTPSAQS